PSLGQFTQLDSVMGSAQNPLSMNRFLYAQANPATLIDPTGHAACRFDAEDCASIAQSNAARKAYIARVDPRHRGLVTSRAARAARTARLRQEARSRAYDDMESRRHLNFSRLTAARAARAQAERDNDIVGGIASGIWRGTVGGVIDLTSHIVTNLDKIPKGVDVLINHPQESVAALGKASGLNDVGGNLTKGWDAMINMSPHDRAEFWSTIVSGTVAGVKGPGLVRTAVSGRGVRPAAQAASAARPVASGQAIVDGAARAESARGLTSILSYLSRNEVAAFERNPAAGSRFLGTGVHRATAANLEANYPGRFIGPRRIGGDFVDTSTGEIVELTTPGQVATHMAKPGYPDYTYATYQLP
ncbi:MAG: hypothetical protein WEB67_09110, partial [Acidimicrobiia bacterium]